MTRIWYSLNLFHGTVFKKEKIMKKTKLQQFLLPLSLALICISFNILISGHYLHKDLSSDETLYNRIAIALIDGDNYYLSGGSKVDLGIEVTPFYSAFVAATYIIGGENHRNPIILNVLFNCLTILLLFYIIKMITNNIYISFISSFVFIFYFLMWGHNFAVMMEITTVFFLTLTIYLYCKYYYKKTISFLYWSVAAFSILTLINNRFIVLFAAFWVFQFFRTILEKINFRKSLIIPVIISIILIAPWFIRQYLVYNQFVFFTPTWNNVVADKIGILKKVNVRTDADGVEMNEPNDYNYYSEELKKEYGENDKLRGSSAFTIEKYNELAGKRNIGENIFLSRLKNYFNLYNRDFKFQGPNDFRLEVPSGTPFKIVQLFILLPLFIFSFLGIAIAFYKRDWIIILFGLFFFSHVILHVMIHFIDRYRVTILPVLVIITGYCLNQVIEMIRKTKMFSQMGSKINIFSKD